MPEPLLKVDPCWGCDHMKYVGYGAHECEAGGSCDDTQNVEWVTALVASIANAIAVVGEATRIQRETAAVIIADALDDIVMDMGGKFDTAEFLRRAGVPPLEEGK